MTRSPRGAIGTETKFTEGAYSWGATEKEQMSRDGSPYLRVHDELWRNQLLGEAVRQRGDVGAFTSVLVYPAGNTHYHEARRPTRRSCVRRRRAHGSWP